MNRSAQSLVLVAAATSLALLTACGSHKQEAPAVRAVVAMPVQAGADGGGLVLPGRVDSRYSTQLSFRIGGKIVERKARLGDRVKAGQVLARLDAADAASSAASARAQLAVAQHQFDFASQQVERDRAQAREQLISTSQLEQSETAYAAALAQRDSAAQQAKLAANQLEYTALVADRAGSITAELADTGQNVAPGQAVYSLAWSGDIDALADVPENVLDQLHVGAHAAITLPALPGHTFTATLRELAPAADPRTHTFPAKLTLQGADTALLRPGMTASIAFTDPTATAQSYALPATALFHDGETPAVWVVKPDGNALELRHVTVQRYTGRQVVLSAGVTAGETIVWQGVHTVSAGQKVKPVPPLHPEDFAP